MKQSSAFIIALLLSIMFSAAWQENLFCDANTACTYGDLFVNGTDDTLPYSIACVFSIYNSSNSLVINTSMTNYSTGWQEYTINLANAGTYHYTINCSNSLVQGGLIFINNSLSTTLSAISSSISNINSTIITDISNVNSTLLAKINSVLTNQSTIYNLIIAINASIISHGDSNWGGTGSGSGASTSEIISALYNKIETYKNNAYGYPLNETWTFSNTSQIVTVIYHYNTSNNITILNKSFTVS